MYQPCRRLQCQTNVNMGSRLFQGYPRDWKSDRSVFLSVMIARLKFTRQCFARIIYTLDIPCPAPCVGWRHGVHRMSCPVAFCQL